MNLPRVMAVARKEARQIVRDSRSLYLALGIPVVLMFLFGYALSLDVDHIPIGVWDQDGSPQSREFVDRLTSSGYFTLAFRTDRYEEIVTNIDRNRISAGIIIPYDFSRNLKKGNLTSVQALVDGSDSTRAGLAIVYLETIVTTFESDLKVKSLIRQAIEHRVTPPLDPRVKLLVQP